MKYGIEFEFFVSKNVMENKNHTLLIPGIFVTLGLIALVSLLIGLQ